MPEGTIFQDSSLTVENNSTPVAQASVVYSDKTNNSDQDVNKISSSRFNPKRLIKIAIFLFLILTIIFIIISIVLPRISTPKVKNVTLLYWGVQDEPSVMAPIIADFEKENPNIKVEYSKQDLINYREKLSTRINNGNGPDIFKFHNTWLPMIKDDLLPLPKETIDKEQFTNDYYDVVQNDLVKNGAIYGLPLEMDTLALYVNTAIFEQAEREKETKIKVPTTWQEFIDASTKLTKRDESGQIIISGAGIGTYDNVDHASDIISLLFAQNGIDINNLSDFPEKISDALRFYTTFSLTEDSVWSSALDPSRSLFYQGKLAMYFGYYWDYFEIKSQNPNLDFKIYPVPQLLNDNKFNVASYWANGVSAKSINQKEALVFMKFLAKEETQKKILQEQSKVRGLAQPSANKKLAKEFDGTDASVFVNQANRAVSSPFASGTFDNGLNDKLNLLLKGIINEVVDNSSLESSAKSLIDGYLEIMSSFSPQPTK